MATKKYVNLLQSHEPLMDSGDYTVTVEQSLEVSSKGISGNFGKIERKFSVFGERFFLEPGSVHSVYPPSGSLGEHSNTFPHIILNRSTLPWERSVDGGRDGIWLALLLFDEAETPKLKTMPMSEYKAKLGFKKTEEAVSGTDNGPFHELGDGPGSQPISVIEVKRSRLDGGRLMPRRADLNFTAHSRRESLNNDPKNPQVIGPERAVIIGNRLPKANGLSTVHLVSLESRFHDNKINEEGEIEYGEFNYGDAGPDDLIQLVSLKSWSFTSVNPKFSLFGMLEHLNRAPSQLSQPFLNDQVLNLRGFTDASSYGFTVTKSNNAVTEPSAGTLFFNESGHLSVEVADTGIDADKDPQLDPFPEPREFTIALSVKLTEHSDANRYPLLGAKLESPEGERFKPCLWHVPGTFGSPEIPQYLEYKVSAENGQFFSGKIPFYIEKNADGEQGFSKIVWVKDGSEFRFYVDGKLMATQPAPARMFTDDSAYLIGATEVQEHPKFLGHLNQLHIFRRALPQGEIKTLFSDNMVNVFRDVSEHFSQGMLALPHLFRKGKKGVSWYRGPLSVRSSNPGFVLPAVAADQLLLFDQTNGMFDTSYAAAWQLGRLMALEDRQFSLQLYNWKRRMSLDAKQKKQPARSHLKLGNDKHAEGSGDLRKKVIAWMRRSYRLEQVPFHYLVPQVDMLPREGIRFFEVDPLWVRCLNDGAASIGRTSSADIDLKDEIDLAAMSEQEEHAEVPKLSGFLLRSELVSGYPGLQILGYAQTLNDASNPDKDTALKMSRREKLSDEVLLCIFEGDVKTVDFFQKPDVLHFGLDSDGEGNFAKQLRLPNGASLPEKLAEETVNIHASTPVSAGLFNGRVADFAGLAKELKTALGKIPTNQRQGTDFAAFDQFTSADFAMEMLEGAERVRFVRK